MIYKFFIFFSVFVILVNSACSSTDSVNSNVNQNINLAIDTANIPPEFSNKPIELNGNMPPGIPDPKNANVSVPAKGATPIPGIPSDPGKPLPKGATPTPGIPDEDALRKQMQSNSPPKPTKPDSNPGATNEKQQNDKSENRQDQK